jgi:pimeloyl-ACP methyl ester carboxylesterase
MPTVQANGVRISYEEQGSGVPVLLIHGGFGGAASTLTPNPPAITRFAPEGVRLITYDRRCAGQSEYVLDAYGLDDIAADVRGLLDALHIGGAIIVGSSMGGMVALQYAMAHPQRTMALVLLNTGPDLMSETPWGQEFAALAKKARVQGDRAVFESRKESLRDPSEAAGIVARQSPLAEQLRARRSLLIERLAKVSDEDLFTYSTGEIRNYGAFLGHDLTPRLGELRMPTLIVHGTADATVPFAYSERMRELIPDSELHAIEGADHGITEYPEAQAVTAEWLARIAALTARV